ncbi:MAG TPA: TonB-dependent receptor [Rhodocyclaceae bacterium]|nr:TonB-dependent receptor [Rhodocyclaceae bacterium]
MLKTATMQKTSLAIAVSMALMQMATASAQEAAVPAASKDGLGLETVVVTATATGGSKMKQSLSVSTMSEDQILRAQPANTSDILRSVPGIHSESSGGGGNANVTVRGLPISAGGSRYVQFQENGLPVLLFGDIAFATPDMFIRADTGIDHLEVVRGGSASTMATNAPGGIINFITKTGAEKGGAVGYTHTFKRDGENRFDFNYGSPLGESTRAFVAGYFNTPSEGARNDYKSSVKGGQIRGNITQDFDGGFVRVNFKHLDDHQPLYMPAPVNISGGKISTISGIDPRNASFYSPYWVSDCTLNKGNGTTCSNVNDGQTIQSDGIGFEAEYKFGSGWKVEDKFNHSVNKGRFISIFPGNNVAAAAPGSTYATGPNAGQAYTGNVFTATVFNTSLDNLNNTVNDFKASKVFNLEDNAKLTSVFGLFYDVQKLGLTWNFNQYTMQATDKNPALINNGGASYVVAQGTNVWGGCCTRAIDAEYKTTAPYFSLAWEKGAWNIDGSIRRDTQKASGTFNQAVAQTFVAANAQKIDYTKDHNSYSFGANYRYTPTLALFGRVSNGVSFNADRIMFNGTALTSSSIVPINEVDQYEGGFKWRSGGFSSFVTLFQAKTKESNYDATTQVSSANTYDAKGVEIELGYRSGRFGITGGATISDSKVKASSNPGLVGKTPNRLSKLTYQITPTYTFGDYTVGASIVGTTASKDAQTTQFEATLPAYTLVNLFGDYRLAKDTTATVGVSNLFNTLAYTESNDGRMAARAASGRLIKVGLKYDF